MTDTTSKLIAQLEDLQERVAVIEAGLSASVEPYMRIGLTRTQAIMLNAIVKRESIMPEALMFVLYGLSNDAPDPSIINVFLSKIRTTLEPFSIYIDRPKSGPLSMPQSSKDRLRLLLDGEPNFRPYKRRAAG